jgi:hypothetical protein
VFSHSNDGPSVWLPLVPAVLLVFGFGFTLVGLGLNLVLSAINARIVADDEGMYRVSWLRKLDFAAAWSDVLSVTRNRSGKSPTTTVHTKKGDLFIVDSVYPQVDSLLSDIQAHTGISPSDPNQC